MINKNNIKEVLEVLGFNKEKNKNLYLRQYNNTNVISIDIDKENISYPNELIVHDTTTSNFSHNENFVVLECVCRLLDKGYRAEHIELEPEWKLGHENKSGKADILVKSNDGKSYIIIECKTPGKEYNKEKKNTEIDGGQLFSYWQQEEATKWLALYTSDWVNGEIKHTSHVIHAQDDANILKLAKKDKSVLVYADAHNNKERFTVWDETYNKEWLNDTIFDKESQSYNIGIPPLLKRKLQDFADAKSIVNSFEEILRHNNVSDKENAFNRLVALFICKLVDEITKQDDDEVDFQYKQGSDTYESLQDRLQKLHQQGMREFMREEIIYVPADYAENLFQQYTGQNRQEAIEDLNETIRILKFYSNNDFAFKDVHNEELFYQNGKILVEVVQLFQSYRIVFSSRNQVLGDLFEGLLNKGFKQNEGQFFTPIPITRFIWDSLPLQDYIAKHKGFPLVIDYACGAGHFLTEAVEAINAVCNPKDNSWTEKHVFGVEKDYRLARVSKISMFMNGAGGSNIIFGDGLENYPEKSIDPKKFDILVANPPYSVKGFKQHLKLKNNDFKILQYISNDGGEIETLFVERISQLLKPNGIAAVILPSSILSNDSISYAYAREQLLKNFNIRTIVAFGSNTFGATGINTVTLFLERYAEPPRIANLVNDSVKAIMDHFGIDEFVDRNLLDAYLTHQHINEDAYYEFINRDMSYNDILNHPYFQIYAKFYYQINFTIPRNATAEDELRLRNEKFYDYVLQIERDKLYYFALVYNQKTVVITAPSDNLGQQDFLGYKWSNRKGNEGIVINKSGGKLYVDENRFALGTLACAVRNSYNGKFVDLSEDVQKYAKFYALKDMMDFSREKFNKSIAIVAKKTLEVNSKYELTKLISFAKHIEKGQSITKATTEEGMYKVVAGGKEHAYTHNEYNREPNVITISASGANAGYVNLWKERIFASDCTTIYGSDNLQTSYIYYYLKSIQDYIYELKTGAAQPHVYPKDLEEILIPSSPLSVQKNIVAESDAIYDEYNRSRMSIVDYHQKINDMFIELETITQQEGNLLNLSDSKLFDVFIGRRVTNDMMRDDYDIPVYSANVIEPFGKINELYITDFSKDSILWGIDGDWMVNVINKNIPFYPTDHCGVIRIKNEQILPKVLCYLLLKEGERVKFSRSYRASTERVKSLSIIAPPIEKQKEIITQVNIYERKIADAKTIMDSCETRLQSVINKYLK